MISGFFSILSFCVMYLISPLICGFEGPKNCIFCVPRAYLIVADTSFFATQKLQFFLRLFSLFCVMTFRRSKA